MIDAEVKRILNEGWAIARSIFSEHNVQLISLTNVLKEREQLGRAEVEALVQQS